MKRQSGLFEQIITADNLSYALLKSLRGKRGSTGALLFCRNTEGNLAGIRERLESIDPAWGPYRSFVITDPKMRTISAAPFTDRVAHHAIMNVLEPVIERQMVYHSYACRKNKGTHAAVEYAFSRTRGDGWFLKFDIRKYFDSIDHNTFKRQIRRILKDNRVVHLTDSVIDSYAVTPGRGVPIGNLTSQFFANLYLSGLDHYILEQVRPRAYVRYMDDGVLWSHDKGELVAAATIIRQYCADRLRLDLKQCIINRVSGGVPFLGFLVKPHGIFLQRKSKRRMFRRAREINRALNDGRLSQDDAARRVTSMHAAVTLARTRRFRVRLWHGSGLGHEPRETRR